MRMTPAQALKWYNDHPELTAIERAQAIRKQMHPRSFKTFAEAQLIITATERGQKPKRRPSPAVIKLMKQKALEREIWFSWLERGITFYGPLPADVFLSLRSK